MFKEMCPGSIVQDWLDENKISIYYEDGLAKMMGKTEEWVYNFLSGEEILDEKVANKLTQIIGYTPYFWLKYERQYRQTRARIEKYEAKRKQETEILLRNISEECKRDEERFLRHIYGKKDQEKLEFTKTHTKNQSLWDWFWGKSK